MSHLAERFRRELLDEVARADQDGWINPAVMDQRVTGTVEDERERGRRIGALREMVRRGVEIRPELFAPVAGERTRTGEETRWPEQRIIRATGNCR